MLSRIFGAAPLVALLVPIAACRPDAATDIIDDTSDEREAIVARSAAPQGGTVIASLTTPTGSAMRFIEIRDGGRAGVLVVEEGDDGTLVMDRIADAVSVPLGASDLYASLINPSAAGPDVGARLAELSPSRVSDRTPGWARDLAGVRSPTGLAAGNRIACDNSNFKSSIPGGFLASTFKRLDTGPSYDPGLWIPYNWSGTIHYWYQAFVNDAPRWAGKACGKAGFHPDVRYFNGWRPSIPALQFLYRAGGGWSQAGALHAFEGGTKVFTWVYDGGLGAIDWKIHIYDAYVFDQFDVMMTWN
jgi:hypothetical protein